MMPEKFKAFSDTRGVLVPVEFGNLPFMPRRLFYVKDVPCGDWRGGHAHRTTRQFLICLKGLVQVVVHDGHAGNDCLLKPDEALLIGPMLWDSQQFLEKDSILLVLCDMAFDEGDYIRDFNTFKATKR